MRYLDGNNPMDWVIRREDLAVGQVPSETARSEPYGVMIQSDLIGDSERAAEMTAPSDTESDSNILVRPAGSASTLTQGRGGYMRETLSIPGCQSLQKSLGADNPQGSTPFPRMLEACTPQRLYASGSVMGCQDIVRTVQRCTEPGRNDPATQDAVKSCGVTT